MLTMFPDSTNPPESCKVKSTMENSNGRTELQEGNSSNVFNMPTFFNVSEQHFDPIQDVCYNECGKCQALQLELDRKEKISSCLKQKLCDFNHIMKANKDKEELCKELTAMTQNLEKTKSELLSKNMDLESMCLDLENKLSESLQDKLKVQQGLDTMNLDLETCRKAKEEFALKNEQLEKELLQYKSLTVKRMAIEEDLSTLQKNAIKKEKKLSKLQEQFEKCTSTLIEKELQIKKIKSSFKTLLKVLIKFGTKLESGKNANKRDKQLLQTYKGKLENFSNDEDAMWNDSMEEFSSSDLENSPQKKITPMYQNNSITNQNRGNGYENLPFNETPCVDFADRKENVSIFQNPSSASTKNILNENSSTLPPAEDSVFPSNSQIKIDPEIQSFGENHMYDSLQATSHSNINARSQINSEISTNSVGNSKINFKKTSHSSDNDNFGLPTSSNGRINVSQNYLFKGYLKQPFAECQSIGGLPACDDGLDISIGDLDNLKQQVCMTKDQFAPLSPLPPTPPPNNQKKTVINPNIKKSLNMNDIPLHHSISSDRLSIPERAYSGVNSSVNPNNASFDSTMGKDISGFNSSPPQFYSMKKPSLCHQQSEGFEVQKDAAEIQPDCFPNLQDSTYTSQCTSSVPLKDRVPHKVSAKRCHDGSIKLDMNFQNNNYGTTDFEVDVESGRVSFLFGAPKPETVKITPSTFSPVVIRNSSTSVSSLQKMEAFSTRDSDGRRVPDFVGSQVSSDLHQTSSQNNNERRLGISKNSSINSSGISYLHQDGNKTLQESEYKQKTMNVRVGHLSASAIRESSSSPKSMVSSSAETQPLTSKKKIIQRSDNVQSVSFPKQVESRNFKKPKITDGGNSLTSPQKVQLIDTQRFKDCNITITPIIRDKKANKNDKIDISKCVLESPDKEAIDISMPAPRSNIVQKRSSTLRKSNAKKFLSVSFVKAEEDQDMEDVPFIKKEEKKENINNESFTATANQQYQLVPNKTLLKGKSKSKPIDKISSPKTEKNKKQKVCGKSIKNEIELCIESDKIEASDETKLQLDETHQTSLVSPMIESPQSPVSAKTDQLKDVGKLNNSRSKLSLRSGKQFHEPIQVSLETEVIKVKQNDSNKSSIVPQVIESPLSPIAENEVISENEKVITNHKQFFKEGVTLQSKLNQKSPKAIRKGVNGKLRKTKQVKGAKKLKNSRSKLSLRSCDEAVHKTDEIAEESDETEIQESDLNKNGVSYEVESPLSPGNVVSENEKVFTEQKDSFQDDLCQQSSLTQGKPARNIRKGAVVRGKKTKQVVGSEKINNSRSKHLFRSCKQPGPEINKISDESDATKVKENDLNKSSVVPHEIESPLSPVAENEMICENEKLVTDQKDFQNFSAPKEESVIVLNLSSVVLEAGEQINSLLTENIGNTIAGDKFQNEKSTDECTNNSDRLISKDNICDPKAIDFTMIHNEEEMCSQIVNDINSPDRKNEAVSDVGHEHYFQNTMNDDSSGDDMLVIAEDSSTSDVKDNNETVNGSLANGVAQKTMKSKIKSKRKRGGKKKHKKIEKALPKKEIPISAVTTALEVLDNLKFNDLHYKQYTHNLHCALLNPSNIVSSNEAVLLIITHLASSKRNPMIPYMASKDPSELLPLIESCIVSCLFHVESKKKPHLNGLLKITVTAIYFSILTKKMVTVYGLASLCRVLCCLCKKMEDRKTPFNLCCGLLKICHSSAPYLIASIAGVWPEVLMQQEYGQDSLLMKVIVYAIFKKPKQLTETLWKQCTTVLNDICNISKSASLDVVETANEILGGIQTKEFGDDHIEEEVECYTPLVILSVTEGWEWFEKNLLHSYFKKTITDLMHDAEKESQNRLNLFCNMFVDISFCAEKENNEAQVFWTAITSEMFTSDSNLEFCVQESLICALMRLYIMKEIQLTKTLTEWLNENQKSICERKIALVYKSHHWKNSSDTNYFRIEDFNLDKIT